MFGSWANVNLYYTPPHSQGLARHYDAHCVFVMHLFGAKRWKLYDTVTPLPDLYDERVGECARARA